jgi:hypothetical protein
MASLLHKFLHRGQRTKPPLYLLKLTASACARRASLALLQEIFSDRFCGPFPRTGCAISTKRSL